MEKQMKIAIAVLIAVGILFAVGTLATYQREKNERDFLQTRHETEKEKTIFKTYYIDGCDLNGKMGRYCECTWNHMFDEKGGLEPMMEMFIQFEKDEKFTPEMTRAVEACFKHAI